jgi:hypothetical protein
LFVVGKNKKGDQMKFSINKKIGKTTFIFSDEAKSPMDFFEYASFYTGLPEICGNCESPNILLEFRETKDKYKYPGIVCCGCNHVLQFGQYRDGNGKLFAKKWVPIVKNETAEPPNY